MKAPREISDARTSTSCLITGGAGFIGCALSSALADRYARVVAIDNLHPQVHAQRRRPAALDARVELVVGDITDPAAWDSLLHALEPDVVIHLAAETGTGQSLTEGSRHADVNVRGTAVMLDAFARRGQVPGTFLLSSSRAVYGEGAWQGESGAVYPGQRSRAQLAAQQWGFGNLQPLAHRSDHIDARPTSIYGATKLAQEHVLSAWSLAFGSRLLTLRLQNVYGPGQSLSNAYTGICSQFAQWARDGRSIPVYEDGDIIRDFVFIDDVVHAFSAALDASVASGNVYDIGSGAGTSVLALANLMAQHYAAPAPHVNAKYRHGDVRHARADITRAQADLHWQPRTHLDEGIRMLCDWIEKTSPATRRVASRSASSSKTALPVPPSRNLQTE